MKSKFRYWAYFLAIFSIACSVMMIMVLSGRALNSNMAIAPFIIFCLFFLFVWVYLVLGEMRTKAISVTIDEDEIRVRRFIGLSTTKIYPFSTFDGYRLSILTDKAGNYEYLYLILGDKKAVKISEKFHANYQELKRTIINKGVKNLGFEPYSSLREFKEIFGS
nr:hypothetical protein [uncultured Mucilaginibacter sp.]